MLRRANIEQIATLAGVFGTRDGSNYADRVIESEPQRIAQEFHDTTKRIVQHDPQSYSARITSEEAERKIASKIQGFRENSQRPTNEFRSTANDVVEKLASHVTARGDELLNAGNAAQLSTMKQVFGARDSLNSRSVVEKIDILVDSRKLNDRAQLGESHRSRSRSSSRG